MLTLPTTEIPIIEIPTPYNVQLFIKREDMIHPEISGNKYWKLFYNINNYLKDNKQPKMLMTFGGAYSNHVSAVSALARDLKLQSLAIIRGNELEDKISENPTLNFIQKNGTQLRFVSRELYRNKEQLIEELSVEFPDALIIPEGGTNELAIEGVQHMLNHATKDFHYLCCAVGTGGTVSGISRFCEENQKVMGFLAVADDSLESKILKRSNRANFTLFPSHEGGFGRINEELVNFINVFYKKYNIPLEPVYTGKMMKSVFRLIENGYFPEGSRILAFHTGGLQGIDGANEMLSKKNKIVIQIN